MSVVQYAITMVAVGLVGVGVLGIGAWCGWKLGEWINARRNR